MTSSIAEAIVLRYRCRLCAYTDLRWTGPIAFRRDPLSSSVTASLVSDASLEGSESQCMVTKITIVRQKLDRAPWKTSRIDKVTEISH